MNYRPECPGVADFAVFASYIARILNKLKRPGKIVVALKLSVNHSLTLFYYGPTISCISVFLSICIVECLTVILSFRSKPLSHKTFVGQVILNILFSISVEI